MPNRMCYNSKKKLCRRCNCVDEGEYIANPENPLRQNFYCNHCIITHGKENVTKLRVKHLNTDIPLHYGRL